MLTLGIGEEILSNDLTIMRTFDFVLQIDHADSESIVAELLLHKEMAS